MTNGDGRHIKRHKTTSYWMIRCPCHPGADGKGYVKEHRLVTEVYLGRFLRRNEHVHHKDGNGLNNSLENLELVTQQDHSQRHKYWLSSPTMGKGRKPWLYENVKCKRGGCGKLAKVNGYCNNHNRDVWRQNRRSLNLAYT